MDAFFLGLVIFIICLFVIELFAYAIRMIRYPDRADIRKRLRESLATEPETEAHNIAKKRIYSDVAFLHQILSALPGVERLDFLIQQANSKQTVSFFVLSSIGLGLAGYLFSLVLTKNQVFSLLLGLTLASLPLFALRWKKKRRMARFEKQLPEALGLIARALRAGHAFTSGMKLAVEEFGEPLGPEFEEALGEINFGMSLPEALKNLAQRVDCPDVKFFVVSVILQRETGGNLAEIIESLANLIRERFKFRGKVRTLSAEGRLSAVILTILPFVFAGGLVLLGPEYVGVLFSDPIGRMMLGLGALLMCIGLLVIRRIVKLEV